MIILDGRALAEKIKEDLKKTIAAYGRGLRLAIVVMGEDPSTQAFIRQKRRIAEHLGIAVSLVTPPASASTSALRKMLSDVVHDTKNTGIVIQLPLPEGINTQYVLNAVPPEKDVDMLSARSLGNFVTGKSPILPPVVGGVKALLDEYKLSYANKHIVIVGAGKLVGRPLTLFFINAGATVTVINEKTPSPEEFTRKADIIVSGAGRPGIITGDRIKEGAILIDAGTSESELRVVRDVDFASVSHKAEYLSPVPGGVGPLTVALLFQNLVTLAQRKKK